MILLDDKHLLMIEPKNGASPEATRDWATEKMSQLLTQATRGNAYLGWHTCRCGAKSGNADLILPNGMITNSLAVHYLEHHRDEVPTSELDKLKNITTESKPVSDWTAEKLGNWKGSLVWKVLYKGQEVGNGFGKDEAEAIKMVQHTRRDLPAS